MENVSNEVLLDANQLRNSSAQKRQIKKWTMDLLQQINDDIKIAHQECRHNVITELPILFGITNMAENDAKREIWSNIIQCLRMKNYRLVIQPREDTCLLKITWYSQEDENTIAIQKRIIDSCRGTI
jgi:hypothetical protein